MRFSRATALEPQTLMLALLLCATLCQVSHQIYDPSSCTLPGGRAPLQPSYYLPFPTLSLSLSLSSIFHQPPFPRAAKLLRIKLYTQITSTPTLSHFTGTSATPPPPSDSSLPSSSSTTTKLVAGWAKIFSDEQELISMD